MKKFAEFVTHKRILILVIAVLLLIPSLYGMISTRINYDILTYLPKDLDSMKGQAILENTFSDAATSFLIVEDMQPKDIVKLKDRISEVDGVEKAIWTSDVLDTSIPKEILPDEVKNILYNKNSTLIIIKYKDSSYSQTTMNAISEIKKISNKQCFLSGMAAIQKDTRDLSDGETPLYVLIAVILCIIVLSLTMESVVIPFIFLLGIGIAVLYNMGTNVFLGQISYITKALAAVLQLAVTMDFSIFLLHRYDEERNNFEDKNEAMAEAIVKTLAAIGGSAATAIAGFLAMCVMRLGLGSDIGLVMAKGVFLGLISTITILPALILVFDKAIYRFRHRSLLPDFSRTANLVTGKRRWIFILLFIVAFIPAIYGKGQTKVYYNLDESLPKTMPSIVATNKLKSDYNMTTTHMIMVKDTIPSYKVKEMVDKIEKVDGVDKAIAYDKYVGPGLPESFLPAEIKENFQKGGYKLLIVNSKYKAATDSENAQIDSITKIVKEYDKNGLVAGEGPLTKDLVEIAAVDFKNVDLVSIIAIFAIILLLFKSVSIPVILVGSIELAIFINMAVPYYTGGTIPFIASIVIGCIQLGSTVNYAILVTTRFREELRKGSEKCEAMRIAVQGTARSVVTSALTFFSATIGVSFVAKMGMIKVLCEMLARGALISMVIILFVLPALLVALEKVINATTLHWRTVSNIFNRNNETAA